MSRRLRAARLAAVPAAAVALAALPGPAAAADACPNAAVRAQQRSAHLPDCRAYEQVSPVDKNGNAIRFSVLPRAGGDAIAYWSTGAFADAPASVTGLYRGLRTPEGWTTTSLIPPTRGRPPGLMDQPYLLDMSADFSRALIETRYPVDPDDQALGDFANTGQVDVYRREVGGAFTWLSKPTALPDRALVEVTFGATTPDLERTVFRTAKPLLPGVTGAQLYLRDGDDLSLVSVGADDQPLPDGAALGRDPGPGATTGTGSTVGGAYPSALSDDAATVFFADGSGSAVPQLYVRTGALDPATAETALVSRSHVAVTRDLPCASEARFLVATADGGTVWFACEDRLTNGATALGGVYAYDVASDRLALAAPNAGGALGSTFELIAADEQASHIWFVSTGVLAAGAAADERNLYVLHDGTVRHVATFDFFDDFASVNGIQRSAVSPDGSRLAFSSTTQLDARAAGTEQVYLHDAAAPGDGVVCVSCRPDGSPSTYASDLQNAGVSDFLTAGRTPPRGAAGPDGQVWFTSGEALVPEDRNAVADVYEYRDGELRLLSTGQGDLPAVFVGASADGRDVFLVTSARLAPQDGDNSVSDVYSVRVDGGFVVPDPVPVCAEDCQGPPRPAPLPQTPPTVDFAGTGDTWDPVPPNEATLRVAPIGAAQRASLAKRGRGTLVVRFSRAGKVTALVQGRLGRRTVRVASATKTVARGGSARLTLRLSRGARTYLARHRTLRLTVTVRHSRVAGAERASLTLRAPAAEQTKRGQR